MLLNSARVNCHNAQSTICGVLFWRTPHFFKATFLKWNLTVSRPMRTLTPAPPTSILHAASPTCTLWGIWGTTRFTLKLSYNDWDPEWIWKPPNTFTLAWHSIFSSRLSDTCIQMDSRCCASFPPSNDILQPYQPAVQHHLRVLHWGHLSGHDGLQHVSPPLPCWWCCSSCLMHRPTWGSHVNGIHAPFNEDAEERVEFQCLSILNHLYRTCYQPIPPQRNYEVYRESHGAKHSPP